MLSWFKKVIEAMRSENELTIEPRKNEDLIIAIEDTLYKYKVNELVTDSLNRLFLMNVYVSSFRSLGGSMFSMRRDPDLMCVNLNSYLEGEGDLYSSLKKLLPILEDNKITRIAEHDLYSLINAIKTLGGDSGRIES